MSLLVKGNSKLGPVYTFSIPAGATCPGKTPTCASKCYAATGHYHTSSVKAALKRRFAAAKQSDFDLRIVDEIGRRHVKLFRLHPSGDLFSPTYARAWLRVFRRCPGTTFWLYTRSWRVPQFRPVLRAMAALPNVHLWFSVDRDTGVPARVPRAVRLAWLMTEPGDVPPVPVDLVFRSKNVKKRVPSETVAPVRGPAAKICPTETGLPGAETVTCAACARCFTADAPPERPAPTRVPLALV